LTVVFTTSIPVSAATNFTTVGGLVSDAGNWDNGLPSGTNSSLNWLPGSLVSLTLTGVNDFAETYWNSNRLLFNGSSKTALGCLSWADATNSAIGLGGGYYSDFDGTSNTLALAVVPEPAGASLLGLAALPPSPHSAPAMRVTRNGRIFD